jgi:hypothetical protein
MNRFSTMFVLFSTALAALIVVCFTLSGAHNAAAQNFGGAGLRFPYVGVYWFGADTKGPQFLDWAGTETTDDSDLDSVDNLIKQYTAAPSLGQPKLYTYGLDFSRPAAPGGGPVPPHLAHWRMYFVDSAFKVHDAQSMKFAPQTGFDQPVYSVDLTPAEAGSYKMLILETPNGDGGHAHYYYRLNPAGAGQ